MLALLSLWKLIGDIIHIPFFRVFSSVFTKTEHRPPSSWEYEQATTKTLYFPNCFCQIALWWITFCYHSPTEVKEIYEKQHYVEEALDCWYIPDFGSRCQLKGTGFGHSVSISDVSSWKQLHVLRFLIPSWIYWLAGIKPPLWFSATSDGLLKTP